jgi:iron complex outermembrane receptor protein
MFDWETGKTIYTQLNAEASMSGNLFELPAGPVGVALGVTGRRDEIEDTPGDITLAGNAWGNTASGITAGKSVTTEAFGELHVPLLKDKNFFKDLSLSAAARITNVESTRREDGLKDKDSGNWTYKLGGNWAVNDWVRFRGTYGTSFRAPALFEQFQANETSFVSARTNDPCVQWGAALTRGDISQRIADNCNAEGIPNNYGGGSVSAVVSSVGGIGALDPETSTAKTASIILTPSLGFLPNTRLSLAVDWFDIRVKGEVSKLGPQAIVFGCYDSPDFPTDPLCSLFTRGLLNIDPFALATITDRYINIAKQQNQGIDVTGLVQQGLGRFGNLTFLAQMTWQLKDKFALFADTEVDNNGEIGDPKWVGDFNLTWRPLNGGWSVFWGTDVIGKADNKQDYMDANGGSLCILQPRTVRHDFCVDVSVPTTFYHAASVTKEFPRNKLEFTLGVSNIFDTRPPRTSTIGGAGIPNLLGPSVATSQYDLIGRRVFFNMSKKF